MNGDSTTRKTVGELVAEAKRRFENLDKEDLKREIESGALVVDIREANERAELGTIPGAIHVPRGLLEFWADPASAMHRPEFALDRRIILHCATGGRSALAAAALQDLGFTNVAHHEPGFNGWKAAGKPFDLPEQVW
jgi:rhodanese-related sulfurtransferase